VAPCPHRTPSYLQAGWRGELPADVDAARALKWVLTWHAGQLRLFVSNNDHTVKIFDVPSMRLMSTVTCPVAVNYAALSPDGHFLACVGDSGATHIYRAATTGAAPLLISLCPTAVCL